MFFFCSLFSFRYLYCQAASIDGLRPTWQPAVPSYRAYTLYNIYCVFLWLIKIVIVVDVYSFYTVLLASLY